MKIEKIQFENVRYNPELIAFETLVRIEENGRTFSYPVHVPAPLHAEYGLIIRRLAQAASSAHGEKQPGLRIAHAADPATQAPQPVQQTSLLERLLAKRAA